MARSASARRRRPAARTLLDSVRHFLTPGLWCPRTAELERRLGQPGKPGSAPAVWLTALVHLRLGVPWAWRFGKGTASERDHLRHLLAVLPAAALVVADAGFVGFDLLGT